MELKVIRPRELVMAGKHNEPVYLKSDADVVIAGLQVKLEAKELEVANLKEDALNTDKAREKWLQLARKQAMEIRRLRKAVYKACANWAHFAVAFFSSYATKDPWHKMELKCLKKVEELK